MLPNWMDWQTAVETAVTEAMKYTGLSTYTLVGDRTNLKPAVKPQNQIQASQPFVTVLLVDVQDGHDSSQSAQKSANSYYYQNLGSSKHVQYPATYLERLMFQISVYGNRYDHVVQTLNAIKRYFTRAKTVDLVDLGTTYTAPCELSNYLLSLDSMDATGNPENFFGEYTLTLKVTSSPVEQRSTVKSIATVSSSFSASFS